jgi:hypothetical protein
MPTHARSKNRHVRDAPTAPTRSAIQSAGLFLKTNRKIQKLNPREAHMGMIMIKCPQTGRAIQTGIKTDRESFRRSPVFFAHTRCPICRSNHDWFAREAWVDEAGAFAPRTARLLA